jgi:KDO2-lipid IV(A) lauroyltransferase
MGKSGANSTLLHVPMYLGMRAATSLPLIAGPRAALSAARVLGGGFARMPFNRKRLQRAIDNLKQAFPAWTDAQREEVAVNAYQHLFQLAVEVLYTPRLLSEDAWVRHARIDGVYGAIKDLVSGRPTLLLCGHCGNWEALGYIMALLGFPMHAVYRPLDMKPLDRWVRDVRARRGLVLVDKFGAMDSLGTTIASGAPIGFVADQNAGDRGIFVPYFGRLASTYKSIGLLAIHANTTIIVGSCIRRTREGEADASRKLATMLEPLPGFAPMGSSGGPSRGSSGGASRAEADVRDAGPESWFSRDGLRYEIGVADVFGPDDWKGTPDPLFYITARYRRAIERSVRWAPEQYLWMHRIWKSRPPHERNNKPFPNAMREKLASLPWMTAAEIDAIIEQSDRDRASIAAGPHKK